MANNTKQAKSFFFIVVPQQRLNIIEKTKQKNHLIDSNRI